MIKTLLEPNILIADPNDWQNLHYKNNFIERFSTTISEINNLEIIQIYWCDELDDELWSEPHFPPWTYQDPVCKNKLIPIIFNKLMPRIDRISISGYNMCTSNPEINCPCNRTKDIVLSISSWAIGNNQPFLLCKRDIDLNQVEFSFDGTIYNPSCIFTSQDWLHNIQLTEYFWPKNINDQTTLVKCIKYTIEKEFPDKDLLYTYEFANQFVRDIIGSNRHARIAYILAKRLVITSQEASNDGQLQDEIIGDERRIRVTPRPSSNRIHYLIVENHIIFQRFYGDGEHDQGL